MWCGSCWAFSTTAALESLQAITSGHGPPVSLSEQMLMDCGSHFVPGSNSYCNGGDPMAAFWYINNTGGICSDADYPCAHTHAAACQPAMPPPAARSERCWLGRDTVRATNCNAVLTALLRLLPLECARIVLHCICEHIDDIMSNASMCTGVAPDYTPTTCKPVFRIGAETAVPF
jgi:hypothetical protein